MEPFSLSTLVAERQAQREQEAETERLRRRRRRPQPAEPTSRAAECTRPKAPASKPSSA
jgi:hypothetical protein